ncbi:MAG: sulfur oxidation c-type cytochrome SoxX [Thiobacillus sp.]
MKITLLALAIAGLTAAMPAAADDALPSNLLYDASKEKKTVWPLPVKNSGELKYNEHRQDLSKWPTLSYEDKRPTKKPEKVELQGPLNGNAENGKKLAMNTQRGNCWACHALPGDAQPGSGGPPLLNVGAWGYSDAHLFQQVWDRRVANPSTEMPPYGTNGVLSEQDVRDIVAFLQSLK